MTAIMKKNNDGIEEISYLANISCLIIHNIIKRITWNHFFLFYLLGVGSLSFYFTIRFFYKSGITSEPY